MNAAAASPQWIYTAAFYNLSVRLAILIKAFKLLNFSDTCVVIVVVIISFISFRSARL